MFKCSPPISVVITAFDTILKTFYVRRARKKITKNENATENIFLKNAEMLKVLCCVKKTEFFWNNKIYFKTT